MSKFPITKFGHVKLEHEIRNLKFVERPKIIQAIADARAFGDLSENAEYHAAKEKQGFIEGRILDLEDKLSRSDIIDVSKLSGNTVTFGATVTIADDDSGDELEYIIVSEYEANVSKKMISIASPIARALIGKKVNDIVEVNTPKGVKVYEILGVAFKEFLIE
jgi:transcription elongation factor GreA